MDRYATAIKVAEAALDDWEKRVEVSVHGQAEERIPPRPTRPCPVPQEAEGREALLSEAQEQIPPRPTRPCPVPQEAGGREALSDFNGELYGEEYLTFGEGDVICPTRCPSNIEPEGWAYGCTASGRYGWFPPSFLG